MRAGSGDRVRSSARIHVIGPHPHPEEIVRTILSAEDGGCVILDLSMGHVAATETLRSKVSTLLQSRAGDVEWVNGLEFAVTEADRSRAALIRWLSDIGRSESTGKSIREEFAYGRKLSLWWLLPSSKHHPLETPYPWLFYSIAVVDRLRERFPGATWTIWGDSEYVAALRSGLRDAEGVTLPRSDTARTFGTVRSLLSIITAIARSVQWRGGKPLPDALAPTLRRRPLLLIHSVFPRFWKSEDDPAGRGRCFDSYFAGVPELLREKGLEVAWLPAFFPGDRREWRDKLDSQDLPDVMAWMHLTPAAGFRIVAYHAWWIARYVRLFTIKRIHERWRFRGYAIGHILRREIREQLLGGTVHSLIQLEQQRHACLRLRPSAVVHRNEFLINGRIIDAAVNGVAPTIAVQHGLLVRHVGVYQYEPGDIQDVPDAGGGYDFVRHCPAPEVLAVFGTYYREYFERLGGYPPQRIFPVGGIRHDRVSAEYLSEGGRARERLLRVRRELGWPEEKPVLLLCATLPADLEPWLRAAVTALRKIGLDAHLVVKPHPEYPAPREVKAIAAELGWESLEISGGDIFEMIAGSDILLAGGSTTVLEAHLLDVPAIVFTPDSGYEVYPFRSEGIGEPVRSVDELAEALERMILRSGEYRPAFRQRRARVLSRHLDSADAKAGSRLADLVWHVVGVTGTYVEEPSWTGSLIEDRVRESGTAGFNE